MDQDGLAAASLHILIVDDERVMANLLAATLDDLGQVSIATSGAEALQLAALQPPDLLLLDVEMPEMDGFAVSAEFRASPALLDTPIIFVTAHSGAEFELRALDAGAVDFIAKPLNPAIVRRRVRTHLALKHQADQLRQLANIDALTRLANRRVFDQILDQEWRRSLRTNQSLSLAMIDIDHFKLYNDRYGHVAGDQCLQLVADTIHSVARRSGDLVARYGGEEFAIVLPATDEDAARALTERVVSSVSSRAIPHEASPVSPVVTVSIGLATIVFDQTESLELNRNAHRSVIALADTELYAAKAAGRNRVASRRHSVVEVAAGPVQK